MMNREKYLGYLFGALTALCWAISPIFIRQGLRGLPSPIWGTAIGLFFATVLFTLWYIRKNRWREIAKLKSRDFPWQIFAGLVGGLGILFRNIALETTQIAVVIALAQTASFYTLLLSPLLLGKNLNERITPKLVIGVVLIVGGSTLIIFGRNV